jgi:hypothetical protein
MADKNQLARDAAKGKAGNRVTAESGMIVAGWLT